jgi:3-dehydroquinate synthetase
LPPIGDLSASDALEVIRRDKKVLDGTLHFVLPTGVGATAIVTNINEAELVDAMLAVGFKR